MFLKNISYIIIKFSNSKNKNKFRNKSFIIFGFFNSLN